MKIVIASGIFLPELGGPATYAAKISQEFVKLGHQVKVLAYSDKLEYDFDKDLKYPVFRIKRSNKLSNYFNYFKQLGKVAKDADLIYAFDHFSAGIPAALFCKMYKKDFYIRVGGDFIWERFLDYNDEALTLKEFYEKNIHLKSENKRFKIIKWVFGQATGIIFTTKFQLQIFKKYYNLSPDKLFVVSNPITKDIDISRNKINKEIVMAGRFIHKNNILNLIKAFSKVTDKSYKLVLIGEGNIKNKMESLIAELNLTDRVFIEPKLSRKDLADRMSKAYLAIWPSLTDISPNSLLEALSVNVPVVSSTEIGFDFIKNKIKTFDPRNIEDIAMTINSLLDEPAYRKYEQAIDSITYDYDYSQAAKDTINILK